MWIYVGEDRERMMNAVIHMPGLPYDRYRVGHMPNMTVQESLGKARGCKVYKLTADGISIESFAKIPKALAAWWQLASTAAWRFE